MKKLLIGLFALGSVPAFAADICSIGIDGNNTVRITCTKSTDEKFVIHGLDGTMDSTGLHTGERKRLQLIKELLDKGYVPAPTGEYIKY